MRYELEGGPLDGTRGEVDDSHLGNLRFPYRVPPPEGHDPRSDLRNPLRYRKTKAVAEDGAQIYAFDSVQHRQ
jgi:hypothetical protein